MKLPVMIFSVAMVMVQSWVSRSGSSRGTNLVIIATTASSFLYNISVVTRRRIAENHSGSASITTMSLQHFRNSELL